MAKLDLLPGETLIGSGQMSLYLLFGLTKKPYQGYIFITNQRACFRIRMMRDLKMNLPVGEIKGFSVGRLGFFTKVTIHAKDGEDYPFTGFPSKKLQGWLQEAGVRKL